MEISKELLYELYITKNLTRKEIALRLDIKERTIKTKLSEYGIKKDKELLKKHYTGGHTTGMHWWYKGDKHTCAKECPGEGWVRGKSDTYKNKIRDISLHRNLSVEARQKMSEAGKKRKGKKITDETKNKISRFWKEHVHPFKGKLRTEDVKHKISKKLTGQIRPGITKDKIKSLSNEQLLEFLKEDGTIDFYGIYSFLDISINQHSWELIMKQYKENDIEFKRYTTTSLFEKEVLEYVKCVYTGKIIENDKTILPKYEIDIHIPDLKLLIECNGIYWHRTVYKEEGGKFICTDDCKLPNYHYNKSKCAYENGYRLIHIWEDQWKDERLRPILEAILRSALGVDVYNEKIYARNCELKEIDAKVYRDFCNRYHTQLSRPAEIKLGLFYKNELVQVASFSKFKVSNRANKDKTTGDYDWEFIRGCEAFNHARVIGGVSKLFSYFVKTYNPKNVLCYSDFNFFNGKGYTKSGFELKGFTGSDKFYIDIESMKRIPRRSTKYREYMKKVVEGKYYCCYGAGSLKFLWTNSKI